MPWLYYTYTPALAQRFSVSPPVLLIFLVFCICLLEGARHLFSWRVVGLRAHERGQLSSFVWSALSITCVLLLSPTPREAMLIVAGGALGDPLLGELRYYLDDKRLVYLIAGLFFVCLWGAACFFWGLPLIWVFIMPPSIIYVESFCWAWFDDNALMQLVPLLFVLIYQIA